ncbi:MAG TPA: hypothetical protein VFE84_10860 [Patescibacteria group bacterium]|nr:hypothetical protein [Patescibacteria group bacterium]
MRRALFRSYAALKARALLSQLDQLERTQWLSHEAIVSLQRDKLVKMLEHAGRTVPYYRELYRSAGFDPRAVASVADLRALPLLDRDVLQQRYVDFRSSAAPPDAFERATGGSTGRPLRFLADKHEMTLRSAHIYRHLRWFGWSLGDRVAYVWGSDIDSREHRGLQGAIHDWFAGILWLDAFRLGSDQLDADLERLARFEPAVVIGYPSSLHLLARRALEKPARKALRGIETSAEQLAPDVRNDLVQAFGCAVLDRYGCREAGVIAHECTRGSLHINAEAVVMEVVEGEVVVTTLNNRSMPLIRYRVEDLAELSEEACPCGRGLPLVRRLRGRLSDIVRSPSGRLIHGEFFTHLFYGAAGVKSFQVAQVSPERLDIQVVADGLFDAQARTRIESAIRDHADAAFHVVWLDVEHIEPGPSGKMRFILPLPDATASKTVPR